MPAACSDANSLAAWHSQLVVARWFYGRQMNNKAKFAAFGLSQNDTDAAFVGEGLC
jgi:hypothetical protein